MSDAGVTSYSCPYCRTVSSGAGSTCPNCGAPVDVARRTTSGWTELPPIPDMAKIQLGRSSAQILGKIAPAADIRLAEGDGVFFANGNLLWQEPAVDVSAMSLRGGWDRMRGGLPVVMLQAAGPGTISLSHDAPGELIVVPVEAGGAIDVHEHHMVAATLALGFDWYDTGIWFSTSGDRGAGQMGGAGLLKMGLDLAGLGDMAEGRQLPRRRDRVPLPRRAPHGSVHGRRPARRGFRAGRRERVHTGPEPSRNLSWSNHRPCSTRTRP